MKKLKREEGFTLIEIMVGINLSFLVLTSIVSVYLLTTKFMNSFSARTEDNQAVATALYSLSTTLEKAESFTLYSADSMLILQTDNGAVRITRTKISVKDIYKIENIENLRTVISFAKNERIEFDNNGLKLSSEQDLTFVSGSGIDSIKIDFTRKNKELLFKYTAPEISAKRFESKRGR
ncbi:MAG TPA: hypothetical protein VHP30_05280 [Ignavibacteriales bacterium]|nr:hypothetical protein [Ignavibacteriales bacterium]